MAATSAGLASSERGPAMARMRTARWLDLIGYAALVFVLLVVIVTQDSQRRQAVEAKEAATAEVARVDAQLAMQQWLDAAGQCPTG